MCFYCGMKPKEIRFSLLGMTMVEKEEETISYQEERLIAFGGPLVNLLFILLFFICFRISENEKFLVLAIVNGFLFLFNSLPIFSLDGGRILLFSLLMHLKDTQIAYKIEKIVSLVFIILLSILGIFVLYQTGYNLSLLLLSIYLFFVLYKKC